MKISEKYIHFINIAIDISKTAKYPYGAIIVKNNKIIGRSDNKTFVENSPYAHSELMAIEDAVKNNMNLYGELAGSTLYTSCEPCLMCMGGVIYEKLSKVVYAATLEDSEKYIVEEVKVKPKDIIALAKAEIEIIGEVEREKAVQVLKNWRKNNEI